MTSAGNLVTYGETHFEKNVSITAGGTFADYNYGGVTIDGYLSITDPAANSTNGFWGDGNIITGNLSFTITPEAALAYPDYQWPSLYFGGSTTVKNVTYRVGALSSVRPFDPGKLTITNLS